MNYPNLGRRKARKEAREKHGADLTTQITAFLDAGWPKRDEAQDKLLRKMVAVYIANFDHLPSQEEILLILGKFLKEHGDHKDEKDAYPYLDEMIVKLEGRAKDQGSPLV